MPSARSASWLNQGLSGIARHFPGLGILPQVVNARSVMRPAIAPAQLLAQHSEDTVDLALFWPRRRPRVARKNGVSSVPSTDKSRCDR